jgi:SNF2 family DNA or RNA helicase
LASIQVPEQDIVTLSTGDIEAPIEPLAQAYVSGRLAEGVGIPTAQETIHAICQAGAEEKVAYLTTQLTEPMVWFARYHATLDVCESALEEASIPYRRVDGSTSAQARAEAVEWFQSGTGPRVFLGQIDAAGISADLFAAQRSYTLDLSWQPESYDQALGRTRRRGQLLRCTHTDLIHNKLQQVVLTRLREGKSFDASVTEYQDLKRAMATFIPTGGTTHE